ncbi:MAG: type IV secretory system conjugative DNA transfer family protein [Acidobacteriaceae bacterium]|nr:type IV secretory system conjugative DNA transfer family protein [Acidobacteriaceae bacterium]
MSNAYRFPHKPGYLGGYNWRSTIIGAGLLLLSNVIPTQYIAAYFGYQPALGKPLLVLGQLALYQPLKWALWLLRYGSSADAAIRQPVLYSSLFASICIAVSLATVALLNMFHNKRLMENTEDLHGSARWATEEDLRKTGLLDTTDGVYVGGWMDEKAKQLRYMKHDGPEHVLAFAPTRSGKGVGLVIPTLLSWAHSSVVYDIKGENWAKTAGFRAAAGQVCFKFSPVELEGARFNPLAEIRIDTPREVSDAQNLAEMLLRTGNESPGDEHWITTGVSLITGLILHVCYIVRKQNRFATMADLSAALTPVRDNTQTPDQTLDADEGNPVREHFEHIKIAAHDSSETKWQTPDGKATPTHPVVAEKIQEMLNREDREFSSVLSTAKRALMLYSDPLVARNVGASDFAISDLVNFDKPVSLYIVVPPSDKVRLKPLIRLMFTLIVNRLTEKMDFEGTEQAKNKHRLLLLIDEFPTLGNMAVFADALSYMAGYGIKAYLITQDLNQIIEHYSRNESIVSNCHIRVAYTPNKIETGELLSKMTGTMTVQRAAMSFSGSRSSNIMTNITQNVEHIQRPLMTTDEIMRLQAARKEGIGVDQKIVEPGKMLIFVAGSYPVLGTQILYFLDKELRRRASFTPPSQLYAICHQGGIATRGILMLQAPDSTLPVYVAPPSPAAATNKAENNLQDTQRIGDAPGTVGWEEDDANEEDERLLAQQDGSSKSSGDGHYGNDFINDGMYGSDGGDEEAVETELEPDDSNKDENSGVGHQHITKLGPFTNGH